MPNLPSSGNKVEQIAKDYLFVAGVNSNLASPTRRDDMGESTNSWGALPTSGLQNVPGARASYQAIDNASDHIGGAITLVAQNKFTVNAGAGGINFTTNGNISMMPGGGMIEATPTECFSCLTKNINLVATESIKFGGGGQIIMDECTPQFGGNALFEKNVAIKGGLFVQGETFLTHITTQREFHYTEPSDECGGYFNPNKKFLLNGEGPIILTTLTDGIVSGNISIPGLGGGQFTITGLNIVLPLVKYQFRNVRLGGEGISDVSMGDYDFVIPGHIHKYETPAVTYKDDTSSLWEAGGAVLQDKPILASPSQPNGMSHEEAAKKILKKQTDKLKKFATNLIKNKLNPF